MTGAPEVEGKDVQKLLAEIHTSQGRMEAQNIALLASIAATNDRMNGHATRLRSLERFRSWTMGGGAALVAVAGALPHLSTFLPKL